VKVSGTETDPWQISRWSVACISVVLKIKESISIYQFPMVSKFWGKNQTAYKMAGSFLGSFMKTGSLKGLKLLKPAVLWFSFIFRSPGNGWSMY